MSVDTPLVDGLLEELNGLIAEGKELRGELGAIKGVVERLRDEVRTLRQAGERQSNSVVTLVLAAETLLGYGKPGPKNRAYKKALEAAVAEMRAHMGWAE